MNLDVSERVALYPNEDSILQLSADAPPRLLITEDKSLDQRMNAQEGSHVQLPHTAIVESKLSERWAVIVSRKAKRMLSDGTFLFGTRLCDFVV